MSDTTQNPQPDKGPRWAHMSFPPGFVHTYQITDRNGDEWVKALVTMPKGTYLNGVDVAYYNLDVFMSDRMLTQKANRQPVTVSIREDRQVELFHGRGDERRQILVMDPWALATAIKQARQAYAQTLSQEQQDKRSHMKNTPSFGDPDSIQVTIENAELGLYPDNTTLNLNQADYILSGIENAKQTTRFLHPASSIGYEKIHLTIHYHIDGVDGEYKDRLDIGDGYHGISDLATTNAVGADAAYRQVADRMLQISSRPLSQQELAESQAAISHAASQLEDNATRLDEQRDDPDYQQEAAARTDLDETAIQQAASIDESAINAAAATIARQADNLLAAHASCEQEATRLMKES
ncbi:LPD25 domain-containing protein, partial [Parascardovia denticolens]|uniref:LPD25 domain-containing protein n=1 Tax=Parascardovia denticolens TaxID=78258 RepID=UPI00248F3EE2